LGLKEASHKKPYETKIVGHTKMMTQVGSDPTSEVETMTQFKKLDINWSILNEFLNFF